MPMLEHQLQTTLIQLVRNMLGNDREVALDDSLLAIGVDSFKMMELIVLCETEFDIEFGDEDLIEENFLNLAAISRLIGGKYLGLAERS